MGTVLNITIGSTGAYPDMNGADTTVIIPSMNVTIVSKGGMPGTYESGGNGGVGGTGPWGATGNYRYSNGGGAGGRVNGFTGPVGGLGFNYNTQKGQNAPPVQNIQIPQFAVVVAPGGNVGGSNSMFSQGGVYPQRANRAGMYSFGGGGGYGYSISGSNQTSGLRAGVYSDPLVSFNAYNGVAYGGGGCGNTNLVLDQLQYQAGSGGPGVVYLVENTM